jgi:ABC-type Fe3+-hydroxamate transport system substrate-binding protein
MVRIISLVPSVTETLFELGLGDQIVAVTRYCILPKEEAQKKQKVGGTKNPDLQGILQLKPDVVIVNMEENRREDAEFLKQHGIELMVTCPDSVDGAIRTVEELGTRFGAEEKSREMCAEMRSLMAASLPRQPGTALILIWKKPFMTVNAHTYVDSICRFFGFVNVFGERPELYPSITDADIRGADPDVVLFPDEPYPFREEDIHKFKEFFSDLRAVKNGKLLLLNGVYLTWHGYGTLRALRELPSVFASL